MNRSRLDSNNIDSTIASFIPLSTIVLLVWVFFWPFNSILSDFLLLPTFLVYLLMAGLTGISCFYLIRWIKFQTRKEDKLNIILLGLVLFLVLYTGHAVYAFATGRFQHFHWIPLFGISFLTFFIYKKNHLLYFPVFISFLILGMGLYESVLAILQFILWRYPELHSNLLLYPSQRFCYMHDGISFIKTMIRPMGTFDSPITLGIFLAALLPLSIWLFPRTNRIETILSFIGIFLIVGALALTYSRAALLSALLVLTVCAGFYFYTKNKSLACISLTIAGFLILWTFGNHWAFARWKHGVTLQDRSITNRVTIWNNSKSIIIHNPILGVGLGNFSKAYEVNNPMPLNITEVMKDQYKYTHNNYWLSLWCEIGTVGFILFFMLIAFLSLRIIKKFQYLFKSSISLLSLWGTLLILILAGFSNSSLGHPFLNLWMWILIGLIISQLTGEVDQQPTS